MSYLNIKLPGIDLESEEREFSIRDFQGKKIILYYYPKDILFGCSKEICNYYDNINRLTSFSTVVGVSPDNVESHKRFKETQSINFILLSDIEHKLAKELQICVDKYENDKPLIEIVRSTFVINENGNIEKEWRGVQIQGHVDEVLEYLNSCNK